MKNLCLNLFAEPATTSRMNLKIFTAILFWLPNNLVIKY